MPASTSTAPTVSSKAIEETVTGLTQALETTIKVSFDLQQKMLDASVAVLNASLAASRTAVDQWLALGKQQQPSLFNALENGVQQFEKLVPTAR